MIDCKWLPYGGFERSTLKFASLKCSSHSWVKKVSLPVWIACSHHENELNIWLKESWSAYAHEAALLCKLAKVKTHQKHYVHDIHKMWNTYWHNKISIMSQNINRSLL